MPAAELQLRPVGNVGTAEAADLLTAIRQSEGTVEIDFSAVQQLDLSVIQLVLVVVEGFRRRRRTVIVKDSELHVLRSALELAGINPELAGLSARITL